MAYNNNWAKTTWLDADTPSGRDLNDLGASIRTWGWGQAAGTITVNANQNTLANLGQVSFASGKYITTSVGIGMAPTNPLTVREDATGVSFGMRLMNAQSLAAANGTGLKFSRASTHDMALLWASNEVDSSLSDGYLAISTRSLDVVSERLRISSLGHLGIGTSAPSHRIHSLVVGGENRLLVQTNVSGSAVLQLTNTGGNDFQVIVDRTVGNTVLLNQFLNDMVFRTNNVNRLILTGSGRLIHYVLDTYASNALAIAGGLATGTFYRTSTGQVMVVY